MGPLRWDVGPASGAANLLGFAYGVRTSAKRIATTTAEYPQQDEQRMAAGRRTNVVAHSIATRLQRQPCAVYPRNQNSRAPDRPMFMR